MKYSPHQSSEFLIEEKCLMKLVSPSADYDLLYDKKSGKKIEHYVLTIPSYKTESFTENTKWRMKTSLPVVKCLEYKWEKMESWVNFEVWNEYCPLRLSNVASIPVASTIYLFKESLIGFERLYEKFGGFEPSGGMIGINEGGKCKVWVSESLGAGEPRSACVSIEEFIQMIVCIFGEKLGRSPLGLELLKECRQQKNFVKILRIIDSFCLKKRIAVPYKFDCKTALDTDQMAIHLNTHTITKGTANLFQSNYTSRIRTNCPTPLKIQNNSQLNKASFCTTPTKSPKTTTPIKTPKWDLLNDQPFLASNSHTKINAKTIDSFIAVPQRKSFIGVPERKSFRKKSTAEEEETVSIQPFMAKNGWEKRIEGLLGQSNLKESIINGEDIRSEACTLKLVRLESLGCQTVNSIIHHEY